MVRNIMINMLLSGTESYQKGGEKVQENIEKLISVVLEDVSEIRKSQMEAKDRLPVEIMALNAVANAQKVIWEGTHQHLS